MTPPFGAAARDSALDALARRSFDILVIGGGITGTGVARDAAMRGFSVALAEKDDFASGTSSRSSRLVHGGLRYLEHGQLHLVFESSRERRILSFIAPHLVRPLQFIWPVYERARIPMWKLRAGLFLYDALAFFRNTGKRRTLTAQLLSALEPALRSLGLEGGAAYFDAITDDARLTLATARAAFEAGAVVVNHVGARELVRDADGVRGAVVEDALGGRRITVRARVVVNATGPWSDEIRRRAEPDAAPSLRGTRGAHIAVSRERIRNNGALTVTSPIDGRVMFILPAGAFTIIGTTDTDYEGSPDAVRATSEDVIYLLRSANAYFPAAHLAASDVVAAWAGIRPLVARPDGEPGSVSREHAILWTARGLLTVSGGKLTTYRAMGAEVVDAVAKSLRVKSRPAPTDRTRLPGGEIASVEGEIDQAKATIGAADVAEHLVHAYGSHWRALWKMAADDLALAERLLADRPYIVAELHWATQYEMALTIGDVLIRRTHVAFETRDHGWSIAPRVAALLAPLLGWDAERTARELGRYRGEIERIFGT